MEFKSYHPIVNFIYFVFVIGFSCFFMHPVCLLISLVCSFSYSVMLNGKTSALKNLLVYLSMIILAILINPLFNHEGATILCYLPSGNPLTLESVIYGLSVGTMIVCVVCWFSCYNEIVTSDKFIYLFGKIIPSLSLILSMTLRFVPRFSAHLKVVLDAQKIIAQNSCCGFFKKVKYGLSVLSIMITWSLENAVETADSMKSRGYGLPDRTSFSIFSFGKKDKTALLLIILLGTIILSGSIIGGIDFTYFPKIKPTLPSPFNFSIFAIYFLLCIYPIINDLWEVRRWNVIKSKI